MTLYHDPTLPYLRPSLIGDLLSVPATKEQHQLENQTTTVLAWLIDRSPAIAKAVLELFLGDHAPEHGRVGARTQLSLPKPGGGALYPDLSICVAGRALQLLVEVKVDSVMAVYPEFRARSQPDVYRLLWRTTSPGDARIRAVGTLTREGGRTTPDPNQLRASDVSWRDLRDVIDAVGPDGDIEPGARLVAESFLAAIDARIAPVHPSKVEQAAFFAATSGLLNGVAAEVGRRISGHGPAKQIHGEAYVGWRIPLPDPNNEPLFLRLYLSPAGTRLNLPGAPDALIAAPERDPNGALEKPAADRVEAAGFLKTRDLAGYWLHRRVWPVDELDANHAATEIVQALETSVLRREGAG